ncbi:DNA mismatch repair endonuclease MutL [bacterium]|nr:MAG: DNA mismatch repair endonuclease MutL [bacterium]
MGRIRVLSDNVANRIAAGEVVERPASVVKELIENSIDADASRIGIIVESGGKDLIVVTDNGLGICPEDIELSLKRHATSKISDADDLHHIGTLGFRGEALPSIASVSRLELISRTADNELGFRASVNQGIVEELGDVGAPMGTTVRVSELFFNTPARRKFLKTASTEFGHVHDVVERIAAAYPRIAITLKHADKIHLDLPQVGTYKERLIALWGEERVDEMLEVEAGESGVAVFGYAAPPTIHWSTGKNIRFVLNGRPIINKTMIAAVRRAYEGTLPPGRQPQVMLFLEVAPELVDVNVHPMKLEVRFRRSKDVFQAVARAIKGAIGREKLPDEIIASAREATIGNFQMRKPAETQERLRFESTPNSTAEKTVTITEREIYETPVFDASVPGDIVEQTTPTFWQAHRTYIFAETKGGVLVIDQHAAHERVLFEEILRRITREPGSGQRLLFPVAVSLTGIQEATLRENKVNLERLGFGFGPPAPGYILVEAVPQEIAHFGKGDILLEVLDDIAEGNSETAALDDFAAMAACRMAIKAGDEMSREEMAFLFDRLFATENPYTCPHGRPTLIRINLDELEKRFARK